MIKLLLGLLMILVAALLFFPALMFSIMSSDAGPENGTVLPLIFDIFIGVVGLSLAVWGIIALARAR